MLPIGHVITSGFVSLFVGIYFKSLGCAVVSFAAGVLIDLDHLIDYYANHKFTWKAKTVYNTCAKMDLRKLYLVLHSYELVAIFWASIYIFSLSNFWKALAIGLTQHLLFDQIFNPIKTLGYFTTYRIIKGFKKELIVHSL
jgi:hypothetical protein